jgi:hypothetical protein
MTESQLTLVKNPLGWNASAVPFDKIVLYNGETPTVTPVVLAKQVDYATHGFPPATEKAFLEAGIRVVRSPVYTGPALLFNFATMKAVAPKEIRQAIAHAIKRDDAAAVALGKSAVPPKFMAGFSDNLVPLWLSEADQKKLNPYEYNPQKAEGMFKEIGYTKGADGVWVSKDGERYGVRAGRTGRVRRLLGGRDQHRRAIDPLRDQDDRADGHLHPVPDRARPASTSWRSTAGAPPTRTQASPSIRTSSRATSRRPAGGSSSRSSRRSRAARSTSRRWSSSRREASTRRPRGRS